MKEEIEEWRVIKDFPNYMVSSLGRVKSVDRYVNHPKGGLKLHRGRILKLLLRPNGYYYVDLYKNGKHTKKNVHRLVAEAFLANPENKPTIDHINGIRTENRVENLRFATMLEQQHNEVTREKRLNGKLSKPVLQYTLDMEFVREWPSSQEVGRQTNFLSGKIRACCCGKQKTAYGYIWKYKEKGVA